jgi:hypothetical protein
MRSGAFLPVAIDDALNMCAATVAQAVKAEIAGD